MDNEGNKNLPKAQKKAPEEKLSGKFRQPRFGLRRMPDGSIKRVPILQHQKDNLAERQISSGGGPQSAEAFAGDRKRLVEFANIPAFSLYELNLP